MDSVNQIEKGMYEGYLWYSDCKEPKVLEQVPFECKLEEQKNPFIVEAQLYDSYAKVSYSVKYVDGRYIAHRYETIELGTQTNDSSIQIEEQTFCANRMGSRMLVFQQWWREKSDSLCEGMKVLQPAELVFVGFKKEGGK